MDKSKNKGCSQRCKIKYNFFDKMSKRLTWLSGPLFVGAATGLITLVIYSYFVYIIPNVSDTRPIYFFYFNIDLILDILLSSFITFNIYFNYYKVISTDPGSPSFPTISGEDSEIENRNLNQSLQIKWDFCKKCQKPKPPRTHHCNVCERCVLKMDHHCPWVSGCVGFYNYRYFFLFLFYLWCGCAYLLIHGLPLFFSQDLYTMEYYEFERILILLSTVTSAMVVIVVGCFGGFHAYLIGTGQTTIENIIRSNRKPNYSLGSIQKNFDIVLGKGRFWFSGLLPTSKPPPGNGCYFKLLNSLQHQQYQQYQQQQQQTIAPLSTSIDIFNSDDDQHYDSDEMNNSNDDEESLVGLYPINSNSNNNNNNNYSAMSSVNNNSNSGNNDDNNNGNNGVYYTV
ncbi:hypothetical protein CYY_006667 [Polysphondylium violaceum]|uniref:Palmitoyltransferase n=1 Tax=Polysphondylium violaceum TaxID=133409 RepID=A0A8J4PT22_9MYCE|nr:hypothetical protein CYY_006667 [Polysphondylium violaceum]